MEGNISQSIVFSGNIPIGYPVYMIIADTPTRGSCLLRRGCVPCVAAARAGTC